MRKIILATLSGIVLLAACSAPIQEVKTAEAVQIKLSEQQLHWIGQQVFLNECAARPACLVHWNRGEAFPSLGIGHFIWYPAGTTGKFVESFPQLLRFMKQSGVQLPPLLSEALDQGAPWPNREIFLKLQGGTEVEQIRAFLASTQSLQAAFILQRAQASLSQVIAAAPSDRQGAVGQALSELVSTPGGAYAVLDYVNFKGEGLNASETYQEQGWGLLQVLLDMDDRTDQPALDCFREAAARVLTQRAQLAENPIEREKWLPGWLKRLERYQEPSTLCQLPCLNGGNGNRIENVLNSGATG
jgi:hypothetical protein